MQHFLVSGSLLLSTPFSSVTFCDPVWENVRVRPVQRNVGKNAAEWFVFSQTWEICVAQDQAILTFSQVLVILLQVHDLQFKNCRTQDNLCGEFFPFLLDTVFLGWYLSIVIKETINSSACCVKHKPCAQNPFTELMALVTPAKLQMWLLSDNKEF